MNSRLLHTIGLMAILLVSCPEISKGSEEDLIYRSEASRPYEVDLHLHWGTSLRWDHRFREQIQRELSRRLSTSGSWNLKIHAEGPLPQATRQALTEWDSPLEYRVAGKVVLVVVEENEGRILLSVREGDQTTGVWGMLQQIEVLTDRLIPSTLHRLIGQAFQPLYRISQIDRDQIDLIAVAGEWTAEDPLFSCFAPRRLARPVIIYRNRNSEIEHRQHLPLTYLSLETRERGRISSRLVSAFPAPLGSGRKNRVELWALGGRPLPRATPIQLVLQRTSHRVLMGHRVVAQPKRYLKDETQAEPVELLSDRHGWITLPPDPNEALVWLYVWSGEALLARVPFVAGWTEFEILQLPDDSDRLRVEGEIERLRSDLVADVSRRAISRIQILRSAKTGDDDQTSRLLELHGELPNRAEYQSRLELIQTRGVNAATQAGSRVAVARIKKACDRMKGVINRFLSPDKEVELREETDALLKLP